jgi:uncharacterized protein YbbC (DUF1343 family)
LITNRAQFQSVLTGLEIAVALHRLFPSDWKIESYSRLLANADTLERLQRGDSTEEIMKSWTSRMESFRAVRLKYLLYE